MSEILQFTESKLGNDSIELAFSGQMETHGAEQFKSVCQGYLDKNIKHLLVNLSQVTVISSSGIGALMVMQEDFSDRGGWVSYIELSKEVRSVVRLMDLEAILNIAANREEALQSSSR